jgi:lysophospholipase L1-like esterase
MKQFPRIGRTWPMAALLAFSFWSNALAQERPPQEAKPADPIFEKFHPIKAPQPSRLLLKEGDRLAICGDSITEQKMYSRIIETYLTVCVPQLKITTRQFGWGGETAEGFLNRMQNDCLRFHPTIATTSYGMNDFHYRAYDEATGQVYRKNYTAVVDTFKKAGVRVVLGSAGCVEKVPFWVPANTVTVEQENLSLCTFRNIDIGIAQAEHVAFADNFWPMFVGGFEARKKYDPAYAVCGKDGVHPNWAGHLMMAYDYLHAMGLDGNVGTISVDLASKHAQGTAGQTVDHFDGTTLAMTSTRYPFCAAGPVDKEDSIRSGMTLVPFNEELNRLVLIVRGGASANYKITWGEESHSYSAAQLTKGINLAADFAVNPFSDAFKKVDDAVAAKQNFETIQIKGVFHMNGAQANMAAIVASTEAQRAPLVAAIGTAFVPVSHTITIESQ